MSRILIGALGLGLAGLVAWSLRPGVRVPATPDPVLLPDASTLETPHVAPAERESTRASFVEPEVRTTTATLDAVESNSEPTAAEWVALDTEAPPATILGVVLRGRERHAGGGLVFLGPGAWERLPEDPRAPPDDPARSIETAPIDARGEFRFGGLPAGDYTLALDVGRGLQHETSIAVAAERPSRRVVLVLGTARVEGHVRDARGQPIAGARVALDGELLRRQAKPFRAARRTDGTGAFAFDDLPAGKFRFGARFDGAWDWPREEDVTRELTLAAGEVRVLDIGSATPAAVWSGTLRTRGGDAVRGGCKLHATDAARSSYVTIELDEHGSFAKPLDPGKYAIQAALASHGGRRIALGDVTIGRADVARDLVLPGARLSGRVVDAASGTPWNGIELRIGLRPRDGDYPRFDARTGADGRFTLDALGAGIWRLDTFPLAVADGARPEITIQDGDVDVAFEVRVRGR